MNALFCDLELLNILIDFWGSFCETFSAEVLNGEHQKCCTALDQSKHCILLRHTCIHVIIVLILNLIAKLIGLYITQQFDE